MEISEITEIRRTNLIALIDEKFGGNRAAFCRNTGKHPNLMNLVLSVNPAIRRNIGEKLARDLETKLGLSEGWLDQPREGGSAGRVYTFPIVRLDALDKSGIEKIVLGQDVAARALDRPSSMANVKVAYAVNNDMAPAISQGDMMFVDTAAKDLDRSGTYVLLRDTEVFVRRITRLITGATKVSADNDPQSALEFQPGKMKLRSAGRVVGVLRFSQP